MAQRMLEICVRQQKFFSQVDEDFFFSWIPKISDAVKFEMVHDELWIYITRSSLRKTGLRELLAMASRYNFTLEDLRCLKGIKKCDWIWDEKKFWYRHL